MRLPIRVATAVRARGLIAPGQKVLVALSGGPDSVALFHCLLELSQKRDLQFTLVAAHLNHGLRGKRAAADEEFCRKLCARRGVPLLRAYVNTPKLMAALKRSKEETARIARRAFLAAAAVRLKAECVAVAHHADDRIETVLYRLCRGTGLAGLQGIGWIGPVRLENEPSVEEKLVWRALDVPAPRETSDAPAENSGKRKPSSTALSAVKSGVSGRGVDLRVVRPLLGVTREEVLAYLRTKRQRYCTDETNFDLRIPRNALRRLVLPLLERKVHPGTRAALWRLAEEAEVHAEKRVWNREWLSAFGNLVRVGHLVLPVPRLGSPPNPDEINDALNVLRAIWDMRDSHFTQRHAQALRGLFTSAGGKCIELPGGLTAERRQRTVTIRKA